jgi:hypothetical protein
MRVAGCRSNVEGRGLRIANYKLQIADCSTGLKTPRISLISLIFLL